MDIDGYPTNETLDNIKTWELENQKDFVDLLNFVQSKWYYPDYCSVHEGIDQMDREVSIWEISTGGWSGNEDLIGAMQANHIFWSFCWFSSQVGGHYVFHTIDQD